MSIRDLNDWSALEMKAQEHELSQIDTPKVPLPTTAQQLAFLTTRCAELQARVHRLQGGANEALLWMTSGESERAKAALSRVIIDL